MTKEQLVFGVFRCDPANARVWRENQAVSLPPKAFDVLLYLLRHPGRLLIKDELLQAIWPETYVTDAVLKVCIGEIRKILSDNPKTPQFIETIHRRGYRFIASVTADAVSLPSVTFPGTSSSRPFTGENERETTSPLTSEISNLAPDTILVGRDAELRRLYGLLEKAVNGQRQVVFVTGEPGIGKTALVEAFVSRFSTELRAWITEGQCLEHYGAGEAYLPVFQAFGKLSQEFGRERLVGILERYAPTWLVQMPALVSTEQRERLRHENLGATPERMLREMAETIEVLTAEHPLVLVLEDLHWSDYATLDLLGALARRRETARLLVIGTYRPVDIIVSNHPLKGLKQELQAHGQCEEVALEPLTPSQVATYLKGRLSESALAEELGNVIYRRTDGNPLFLVNFVDYLLAQGVLYEQGGRWELRGEIEQLEGGMPDSIRQMIERQLEQLTPDEQRVLEAASVVGVEFTAAAVEAALEESEGWSEERCDRLARQQRFLCAREPKMWPDGTVTASYAFTHALYQNLLTQRMAAVRRLRLHQRIGERLEAAYGTQTEVIAAELAVHFEQGRNYRSAIFYLQQLSEQATRRYANREAVHYLSHALGLLRHVSTAEQDSLRLSMLEQRGLALRAMGHMRQAADDFLALATDAHDLGQKEREVVAVSHLATALSWLDREKCLAAEQRAVALSQILTNENLRLRIGGYAAYWNLLWRGWRSEDAPACAAAAEAARQANDMGLYGVHIGRLSFFQSLQADYQAARQSAAEGRRLTREVGDAHNYLLCFYFQAVALLHSGQWGEMVLLLREGIAMAERNGNKPWEMVFRLELAWLHVHIGDFAFAREVCEQGLALSHALSLPIGQLISPILLGFAQLGAGLLQEAFQSWSDIARRLERERLLMDWIWQMPLRLGLGEYWMTQGNWRQARDEAEQLCMRAAQPGERTYLALSHRLLAAIALEQRNWDEAEQEVRRSLSLLEGIEAPLAEWRVCATAAQLATQRRRQAQARSYWERSKVVLLRLANALAQHDALRQTFLAQPLVTKILQRS